MSSPIADLSYRTYTGPIEPSGWRWWTIARMMTALIFQKKIYWVATVISSWYFLVIMTIIFYVEQFQIGGQGIDMLNRLVWKDQFYHAFGSGQLLFMLITLMSGSGSIANDNQANALVVYLSKPCSRLDYILGKLIGTFLPIFTAMALPATIFFAIGLGSYQRYGFFTADPWMFPKVILSISIAAAFQSSLIVAISSLFRTGRGAAAVYAAIYFVLTFFAGLMGVLYVSLSQNNPDSPALRNTLPFAYASIDGISLAVFRQIMGFANTAPFGAPGTQDLIPTPPVWLTFGAVVLVGTLGVLILSRRVRAVEVVG